MGQSMVGSGLDASVTAQTGEKALLQLLLQLMRAIGQAADFNAALGVVLRDVCLMTGWVYGEAWIPDEEESILKCAPVWHSVTPKRLEAFRELSETIQFEFGEGLPGKVWHTQRPVWIPDVSQVDVEVFHRNVAAREVGLRAGLAAPIAVEDTMLAVLVFFLFEAREEDMHLVSLVSAVAAQLGQVVQRKRAEEEVRAYRERLEDLVAQRTAQLRAQYQGSPIPTYTWQRTEDDFVLIDYNEAAMKMTRGGIADLIGIKAQELYHDTPDILADMTRCFTERVSIQTDMPYTLRTTGQEKYFSVRYAFVPPDLVLAHTEDITEQKLAEMALRESEQRFRRAIMNSPYPIMIHAEGGEVILINHSWLENTGYRREDIPTLADWIAEAYQERGAAVQALIENLYEIEGRVYEGEFKIITADGTERVWDFSSAPLGTLSDGRRAVISVGVDMTERLLAEAALRESRARLESLVAELSVLNEDLAQASQIQNEFLASVSHELRTPLNAVLGITEVLLEDAFGSLTEKQRAALATIAKSGQRLLELINDILDLSKLEAGKLALEMDTVQVENLCQSSLRLIRDAARHKQIEVVSRCTYEVTSIWADFRRLRQILVSLLENAVKFTPPGGTIGLDVKSDLSQDTVNFTVWDTGIGIKAEDLSRLFQPFVQLDGGLARHHTGTGLGLALVHRLTEMHGGQVSVESVVGQGSRFTVSLPRGL